ncbi:RNA dependent RNA polymerase [Plasmopara viticola lesion associated ourmia-like virus 16]|uniref:RNA dependent RNA polymerase n=1 Tax=Plasmopara viticola lesion associated ourmia-like virus 16 TaxID=2686483 RepID=A0ABX6FIU0_9VIRU|nr:RNA dependent RNA polymerase [Plasmopara viticola lesion associated ourmia-like virus 16]QGY72546.1 RNA dependent RNA polymerase [Plasmopara viticola lesion associated ourmia-like virus 16]
MHKHISLQVRARNIALRCVRSTDKDGIISRLERFTALLSDLYGVNLIVPTLQDNSVLKEFCSGLIEGSPHPWRETIRRLSSRSRLSVAASLFLFRKLVPSTKPNVEKYVHMMAEPSPVPDQAFVNFCVRETRRLFPFGWDRSYVDKVLTSTLPLSACAEVGRQGGGSRGVDPNVRWNRNDYITTALTSGTKPDRCASVVCAVETGGKWRVITKPPKCDNLLRPLHQSLYDHLSKFPWLLRGDANPGRFRRFTPVPGETFVSGDYESATDNLCTPVQREILVTLLRQCAHVPLGVREHAVDTLQSEIACKDGIFTQGRGQLMGELLSFPLLCLVNYLTFKFSVPRDVPVKINGDDIVFRALPSEVRRWETCVGKSGLKLSVGKTMKSARFFSLNSAFFDANLGGFVPFLRPRAVWSSKERACEKIASLKSRFYSCGVGFGGDRKDLVRAFFVAENRSYVMRSRRSLTRALEIDVGRGVLEGLDLWHRELYYLEQDSERPLPSSSYASMRANDLPTGYSRVSPHWYPKQDIQEWSRQFSAETVVNAWEKPVLSDSDAEEKWWREHDQGCPSWTLSGWNQTLLRRMMKLTRAQMWRWLVCRRNASVFGRLSFKRGCGVWKPDSTLVEENAVVIAGDDEKGKVELKMRVGTIWEDEENYVRLVRPGPGTAVRFTAGRAFFGPPPTFDSSLLQSCPLSAVVVP